MIAGGRRPTLIETFNNTQDFPSQSAVFQIEQFTDEAPKVYIPNPDLGTVLVGAYGNTIPTGTAGVYLREVGSTGAIPINVLPTNSSVGPGLTGLYGAPAYELYFAGTGTITLAGMVVMTIPEAVPQAYWDKPFISGRGTSGLRFNGGLTITGYSSPSAKDLVSVTANFVEVGAWER